MPAKAEEFDGLDTSVLRASVRCHRRIVALHYFIRAVGLLLTVAELWLYCQSSATTRRRPDSPRRARARLSHSAQCTHAQTHTHTHAHTRTHTHTHTHTHSAAGASGAAGAASSGVPLHRFILTDGYLTSEGIDIYIPPSRLLRDALQLVPLCSLLTDIPFNPTRSCPRCAGIAQIAYHPLTELNLTGCQYVSGNVFVALRPCATTLRSLDLTRCDGIEAMDFGPSEDGPGLSPFIALRRLGLSGTLIGVDGLRAVSPGVEWLDLSDTGITSACIHDGLRHLTSLRFLNASATLITYEYNDAGGGWTLFEEHHGLRGLDIAACALMKENPNAPKEWHTASRLTFFERLSALDDLRWLNLSGLYLCGQCFGHVFRMPKLRFIGAHKSNILEEEIPETIRVAAHFTPEQVRSSIHTHTHTHTHARTHTHTHTHKHTATCAHASALCWSCFAVCRLLNRVALHSWEPHV
jgi:hypothetical protein